MATPVKVYGPPMSTAVSRVLACLIEKDVDFQLISLNMSKGEHKKPDFLKIQVQYFLYKLLWKISLSHLIFLFFLCYSPLAKFQLFKTTVFPSSVNTHKFFSIPIPCFYSNSLYFEKS